MKAGWKEFLWLAGLLFLVLVLVSLVVYYGGLPLPVSAMTAYCHDQAVASHQQYLTALTAFSQKSRDKLMQESRGWLARAMADCEANREKGIW